VSEIKFHSKKVPNTKEKRERQGGTGVKEMNSSKGIIVTPWSFGNFSDCSA
jgi:hypothetical protein